MPQFFKPNLDRRGRLARLLWGGLCAGAGLIAGMQINWLIGGTLIGLGLFSLFEAARGWCILRACGIKTKY